MQLKVQNVESMLSIPFDFIFIDGSHQYDDVKRDVQLFYPSIKPGGVLALHNVIPTWPGPLKVWTEISDLLTNKHNCGSLFWGTKS